MKDKINIMVVDDYFLMREGLADILELEENINVVATACDGAEAIEILKEVEVDVVLLDINMPNMNGIETLKKLKYMNDSIKIIMLTVCDKKEYVIEALRLGADGYMLKDLEASNLVSAIVQIYKGGTFIHSDIAGAVLKELDKKINFSTISN